MRVKQSTERAIELKELLMRRGGWTRYAFARRSYRGVAVDVHNPDAKSFCLMGGMERVNAENRHHNNGTTTLRRVLRSVLKKRYGTDNIAVVNDNRIRNKTELGELLDEVIEATK